MGNPVVEITAQVSIRNRTSDPDGSAGLQGLSHTQLIAPVFLESLAELDLMAPLDLWLHSPFLPPLGILSL